MNTDYKDYALYDIALLNPERSGAVRHYVVLHRTQEEAVKSVQDVLVQLGGEMHKDLVVHQSSHPFNEFQSAMCIIEHADGTLGDEFRFELELVELPRGRLAIMRKYENKVGDGNGLDDNWHMTDRYIWPFEKMHEVIPILNAFTSFERGSP